MASSSFLYYLCLFLLLVAISQTNGQNGVPLSLQKDPKTRQYYTTITVGSNRSPINVIIDLGGPFLWFSCNNYKSNTYAPIPCGSRKCELAKGIGCYGCNLPKRPGCTNDTCSAMPYNPFTNMLVSQGFYEDSFHPIGRLAPLPQFIFSCMDKDYLKGLARGTTGMLGLARTEISIHKQVNKVFGFADKFYVCFPSSSKTGKLLVGGLVFTEIATKTTPLIVNPVSTYPIHEEGEHSDEYFVDVKSIRVAGKTVSVKDSYFSIDKKGVGGTKISSLQNFTALHNSIYKPFTRAFVKAAADMKIKSVAAVPPFRVCFSTETIARSAAGFVVPEIDLVLPGRDVYWRIGGGNSIVEIDRKTSCLAFVDGGSEPRTSIVIGGHQLEENFLEFDLVNSQLKFSSSLLLQNTNCSSVRV